MPIANDAPATYRTSAVRPGPATLIAEAIRELASRRRLIAYLVRADIRRKGTDTLLGNLWWALDPLIAMAVYVFVMGVIFQRSVPDFPIYILAAVVPFKWFTSSIGGSTGVVAKNERLIKQIQFPKLVLPIADALAELVSFAFGVGLLILLTLLWAGGAHASLMLLWIPVIAAVQLAFSLGITLFVSATTVFYRDVGIVVGHVLRMLFFISPILWSFEDAQGRGASLREGLGATGYWILEHNPVAILLASYRRVIYGQVQHGADGVVTWSAPVAPDLGLLAALLGVSLLLLVGGTWFFKRLEPAFAKIL